MKNRVQLKEDPDTIYDKDDDTTYDHTHIDAVTFAVCNEDVYVLRNTSTNKYTHGDLLRMFSCLGIFKYEGRLWLDGKLISFWKYPSKINFFKLISKLEKELNIKIINNNWRVQVYDNARREILIPIENYTGKQYNPLRKDHILSPLKKKKTKPPYNKYKEMKIPPAQWRFYKDKNVAENIINEEINKFVIEENIQLADKVYFKTNKLSKEDRDIILKITGGNNYTKLIADLYYYDLKNQISFNIDELKRKMHLLYNEIKNYNKNVFPIIGYDVYKPSKVDDLYHGLEIRKDIINEIKKLPSFAIRNLKNDIRKERTLDQIFNYFNNLEIFMIYYSLLLNRDKEIQKKILQKMFKGGNTTLEDLMKFVDDKENFIGGVEFTKDDVKKISEEEDFEIIYEQGGVMIVRVDSPDGIKAIGCNSLWCFTYGEGFDNAYKQWNDYSYNDIVYVLIDFNLPSDSGDFMFVLIKPLTDGNNKLIDYNEEDYEPDIPMYNMLGDNFDNPYFILKKLFGENYKNIIYKHLNFED